jgi:hypothetical protein
MPDDPKSENPDSKRLDPGMTTGDGRDQPIQKANNFLPFTHFVIFFLAPL